MAEEESPGLGYKRDRRIHGAKRDRGEGRGGEEPSHVGMVEGEYVEPYHSWVGLLVVGSISRIFSFLQFLVWTLVFVLQCQSDKGYRGKHGPIGKSVGPLVPRGPSDKGTNGGLCLHRPVNRAIPTLGW